MKCTPEFLEEIRRAVESVSYGSVEITLSEKGSFVELIIKSKVRYDKDIPYKE